MRVLFLSGDPSGEGEGISFGFEGCVLSWLGVAELPDSADGRVMRPAKSTVRRIPPPHRSFALVPLASVREVFGIRLVDGEVIA